MKMPDNTYVLWIIVTIAAVTALIRFFPFIVMGGRETPAFLNYLGKVLPYAVMAMLVVYCLKDVRFALDKFTIAQSVSVLAVVIIHVWRRNTLLSIVLGTACYMVMIRVI